MQTRRIEKDDAHISNSTFSEDTEFSLESYVILEPVLTRIKKGLINTRRSGPFLTKVISGNTHTVENLVNVRVHINRLVPFIFNPERVNPQSVAACDFVAIPRRALARLPVQLLEHKQSSPSVEALRAHSGLFVCTRHSGAHTKVSAHAF